MKGDTLISMQVLFAAAVLLAGLSAAGQAMQLQPSGGQKPSAAVPLNAPLPPNGPTSTPLPPVQTASAPSALHRARVDVSNGLVTISASNSSLNQILREIARRTGIQITGGVTDERVFGTYGPADLPTVLALLLDGTGSNMMLSGDNPGQPKLLTLTPRQGGISPPSPSAFATEDLDPPQQDLPPQRTSRTPDNAVPTPQPLNLSPGQALAPPATPAVSASTQPDAAASPTGSATTTDQSPNGVKTPQQIYDQLMKLQSQQPKSPQ